MTGGHGLTPAAQFGSLSGARLRLPCRGRRQRAEAHPVKPAGPQLLERLQVPLTAIPLVLGEAIPGELRIVGHHQPVAVHLGNHRGGGDRDGAPVAAHEGALREAATGPPVAVHQDLLWRRLQAFQRLAHRPHGSLEYVEAVYVPGFNPGHGQGQGPFGDLGTEPLSRRRCQDLGVVQAGEVCPGWQDHGGGHHRPGQAAAADFVDPGNAGDATAPQLPLGLLEPLPSGFIRHLTPPATTGPHGQPANAGPLVALQQSPQVGVAPSSLFHEGLGLGDGQLPQSGACECG